jgi:hypothetical protein
MNDIINALLEFKKQVHDKAVYPHSQDMHAYISLRVFDAILQEYVSRLEGKHEENDKI